MSEKFQSYNAHMGRWVLFSKPGMISKSSKTKFSGVPVRGKKSKKGSSKKSPVQKKTSAKQGRKVNRWPKMWLWKWI